MSLIKLTGELVNLTPHDMNVFFADDSQAVVPASGQVARVHSFDHPCGTVTVDGSLVPLIAKEFGDVVGLPEPDGRVFIVSGLVLSALKGSRPDVVAPGEPVRNAAGQVVGLRSFAQ